jgi:hypothetical protein
MHHGAGMVDGGLRAMLVYSGHAARPMVPVQPGLIMKSSHRVALKYEGTQVQGTCH